MASIRKRRNKWQVQIRRKSHSPLCRSFIDRKDAVTWARSTELEVDRHGLPADRKILDRVTLGKLVERYRDTVSVNKRRHSTERIELNAFLRHSICSRRLSELRTADFAAYRDERLLTIKPVSLKRSLVPIRNMFEVARSEWSLPLSDNPLDKLKLKAPDQRRERRLQEGEFEKLIEATSASRNPLIAPIIRFALATGMRRGEIVVARWAHLNTAERALLIPDTKNGRSRTIPLTQEAIAVLAHLPRNSERMFPITGNAFRLAWNRVRRRAGLEDLRFHDLRHEAVSRFFERGLTTPEVALISGHRDMRMLFRYTHAQRRSVIKKLDAVA